MPDSIVNAYEESDVLDPRTDAERPSVPPVIKPVDLGPVHVETPVVLSPMAGVTNWPFRVICESYGPDGLYVAEMITARALVARNPKALRLCRFAPSEKIRSLQLYGVNPVDCGAGRENRHRREHGRPCRPQLRLPGAQGDASWWRFRAAMEDGPVP